MYANSLSKTTGVKHETLYICLDHPEVPGAPSFSANGQVNSICDKFGYVGFGKGLTGEELKHISSGNDVITWTAMHEIAHSYACYVNPSTFLDKYGFADDFLTNIRGMTAIQNCDNLHNTKIYYPAIVSSCLFTWAVRRSYSASLCSRDSTRAATRDSATSSSCCLRPSSAFCWPSWLSF